MSDLDLPLSYSADELLGVLTRQVHGEGPASAWLRALVAQDRVLVASVVPAEAVDTLVEGGAEAGEVLTRATLASHASRRALAERATVARTTDVAAAVVELAGRPVTLGQPTTPRPLDETPSTATAPGELERARTAPGATTGATTGRARTFRVFVSSTFEDFGVERDVLRREVWPPLRELCARNGARFQPIDLRWGVSEEAAVDQQAMNICLGEIERCQQVTPRPDFLVLLGNRYGWLPPPPQIPEGELTAITTWLGEHPDAVLPWAEDQVPHADELPAKALLERWYERDDNAVLGDGPFEAEYRLRRRTGPYLDRTVWGFVEARLVRALGVAVTGSGGLSEQAQRRYLYSATAQEIAAGALDAKNVEQAICFVREIDAPEAPVGAAESDRLSRYVDSDQQSLGSLKHEVSSRIGEQRVIVPNAPVTWDGTGPVLGEAYERTFAARVLAVLTASITEELEHPTVDPVTGGTESSDPLEQEVAAHRRFAAERRAYFTGREDELALIDDYLDGEQPRPLTVHGGGGTGKSAVMAEALRRAEERGRATVVARFIGATPGSSDGRSLVASLCEELARATDDTDGTPVPREYADLVADFARRLEQAATDGPVWVFVDSLDQLAGATGMGARSLSWVPQRLPAGVRLVLSTRPGDTLEPLRARADRLELGGLPAVDSGALLTKWLGAAHRTLQEAQRQSVLEASERSAGNPLYLRLAFEEARRWVSGDGQPPEELATGVRGLIEQNLLARLASEDNHGEAVVAKALGYLAASRHGLAEDELMDLLSRDPDLYRWFLHDAYHLPGDLVDSAEAYPRRPASQDPRSWLTFIREASRILAEEPWHLYALLEKGRGQTVEDLAGQAELHPQLAQRILSRLSSDLLAVADEQGRWRATADVPRSGDPDLDWAKAYRKANGGKRWQYPELDPAALEGSDEDAEARAWLHRLEDWRDELDLFLAAVVPALVPESSGQPRLVSRPRPGPDLPVVFWSRLSFDLAPYLTERRTDSGDLLGFYHRELQDVAAEVYTRGENGRSLHSRLADYFQAEADPLGDRSWAVDEERRGDVRGLSELPFHLTGAERWEDVYETLTDFRFLEQKATWVGVTTRPDVGREKASGQQDGGAEPVRTVLPLYTGVFQLQDDYDRALRAMPGGEGEAAGGGRLIVTAVDLGEGLVVRCPHCNTVHPFERECGACGTTHDLADWRGKDVSCPLGSCGGRLRVNSFVVDRASG